MVCRTIQIHLNLTSLLINSWDFFAPKKFFLSSCEERKTGEKIMRISFYAYEMEVERCEKEICWIGVKKGLVIWFYKNFFKNIYSYQLLLTKYDFCLIEILSKITLWSSMIGTHSIILNKNWWNLLSKTDHEGNKCCFLSLFL